MVGNLNTVGLASTAVHHTELADFVGEWESVFESQGDASPFLLPSWVAQWLAVHGEELKPEIYRWGNGAAQLPDAIALLVPGVRRRGPVAFRQLYLNTDGEAQCDSVVVENNRLLCRPHLQSQATATLAAFVVRAKCDEFVISGVDGDERDRWISAFPGWWAEIEPRQSCYVDLEVVRSHGGDPLACMSANTRSQVRRSVRKYEAVAPLEYDVARTGDDAVKMLEELIVLHNARWQAAGGAGAFASSKRRDFHAGFVRRAVPRGEAHIMRVRCGSETIAVLYNLVAHGFVNFYQSGFHQPDSSHLKPGLVSHCLAIRHFAAAGFREYDFLASAPGESRYKESLSTNQRTLYWLTLARPNVKNAVLRLARHVRASRHARAY